MKHSIETSPAPSRDPRLDFFRGLAMLIIFIAHVPLNWWVWYIPARFGFSDATEMFVFLSGFAASIAFGGAFRRHGFLVGCGRIGYRIFQLYIAHICMFIAILGIAVAGNEVVATDNFANPGVDYVSRINLWPFLDETPRRLLELLALQYVPNFFDIMPMYLGALALVPVAMALARVHPWLPAAASVALYCAMWVFGFEFVADTETGRPWFFNPFGWQLIFFTGFSIGSGWVGTPGPSRGLITASVIFLVIAAPLSHWTWSRFGVFADVKSVLADLGLTSKTNFGLLRWLHFMAAAYVIICALKGREQILAGRWARPVIKTGQNALGVFVFSMGLAFVAGMVLDALGRSHATMALVNLAGLVIVVLSAYVMGWFKAQPWRRRPSGKASQAIRSTPASQANQASQANEARPARPEVENPARTAGGKPVTA